VNRLKDKYWATPVAELYVIIDEKGNVREKVEIGRKGKAPDTFNKIWTSIKNAFS